MQFQKTADPKQMDIAGRLNIRNNSWLLARLDYLWSNYFSDISQDNPVYIKFGKYSKFRLGSIKYDPKAGSSPPRTSNSPFGLSSALIALAIVRQFFEKDLL